MEVHIARVSPFTTNGDSKIQKVSVSRRSHNQEIAYHDVQGETSSQSITPARPYSHNEKDSPLKAGHNQDGWNSSFGDSNLRFGVIPQELHSRLLDLENYKSRTSAIAELKILIEDCNFSCGINADVVGLISFLCNLLDDKNFTVVHVTLDVLNSLVISLGEGVDTFLPHVIASTVKVLGDSKITIKQKYMKLYMRLMKVVGPFKVLTIMLENLKHKYSRVREEVVNICIISLLTHPSEDFNLPFLARQIAPCLIDSKRKVRHAALEAFAVLASSMGPGKSLLLKAVDAVELQENGEGLMHAVQARLARKTLPRITTQGLIEYALPFPSSAISRGTPHLPGADTDWVLTDSRVQSGHYPSSVHTGETMFPHIDPVVRRILNAGKGKNKLPWENCHPGASDGFLGNSNAVALEPDQRSSQFDGQHTPIMRTPIAKIKNVSGDKAPHNSISNSNQQTSLAIESPMRFKAAMVKKATSRIDLSRTRPVPPINNVATSLPDINSLTTSQENNEFSDAEKTKEDEKIGIDLLDLSMNDCDDHEEMNISLRNVRNSAAKKRAKLTGSLSDLDHHDLKMEMNLESPNMTPTSPMDGSYSESGVYSRESPTSPMSPLPQIRKLSDKSEVTLVPKLKTRFPKLPSARNKETPKKTENFNPATTTYEKPVRVIGQRMGYKSVTVDAEEDNLKEISAGSTKPHPRDQQKPLKPIRGITGSTASFQQVDYDWTNTPFEDSVAIVGKGVFENAPQVSQTQSQSSISSPEDPCFAKQTILPPTGVYGRAVHQSSHTVESDIKVTISKSARDKMRQKRERSLKEFVESKELEKSEPAPKERPSQTDPSPAFIEIWSTKPDYLEGVTDVSPPGLKRTSSLKKRSAQSPYRTRKSSITHSSDVIDLSLKELSKPESSVAEALRLMADDDWEKKIKGLTLVRTLCVFHSDLVIEKLHDLKLAVTQEIKNLRSGVSRAAILCLGDMFTHLKKNMDYELDNCVKVLLHKAGETTIFIREDVDKALDAMVQNVTPVRVLNSLINGGLSHLNNAVKKCTAQHLSDLVEKMGPGRILSGIKDITDRALPAIAKFAQDSSQETRFYGRKMLHFLMSHPDFDKMLEKYILPKDVSYLKQIIKNIQQKGVGELQETPSAKGRRSYHGSVGSLRASSVSQNKHTAYDGVSHTERKSPYS